MIGMRGPEPHVPGGRSALMPQVQALRHVPRGVKDFLRIDRLDARDFVGGELAPPGGRF